MGPIDKDIHALLFDFIGVLLIQRSDYLANSLIDSIDEMIGLVTDDKVFKRTIDAKYHLQNDDFSDIIRRIVDKYTPFIPLWNLLPMLGKQYKLGVINNGTNLTYPLFEQKLNLSSLIGIFISSGKEGVRKPDNRIYLLACKRLNVTPEQCLYMDDSEENVLGARCVGMRAIYWKKPETGYQMLIEELKI